MLMKRYMIGLAAVGCMGLAFTSCDSDDLDPESIFTTDAEVLDPQSSTYQLDVYCEQNFRVPYNLQFRYKLQDVGTDMNYNLVPAVYDNSVDLAVLVKHMWFDVYDKVVPDKDFMKKYAPRIIHLIGSPAVNPANQTVTLGLAEGGLKVSLFSVNQMDVSDIRNLNEYYLLTMHHEFSHILHQTKTYPKSFEELSVAHYDPMGWQDRDERVTASLGFVSNYASGEAREDFAETIAHYITETDEDWAQILEWAGKGWQQMDDGSVKELDADTDGVDGVALINQKVEIARQWLKDAWNIDLNEMRNEVQRLQTLYNGSDGALLDEWREEVYSIPTGGDAENGSGIESEQN